MNVAELIEELQRMPQHARVDVVMRSVAIGTGDIEAGFVRCEDVDAQEADEVRHMGPFVLIRGR